MTFTPPVAPGKPVLPTCIMSFDFFSQVQPFAAPASNAWPAANVAIFVPFSVDRPLTVYEGVAAMGTVGAGNFDLGVYDSAGNRLTSSGATARSAGTNTVTTTMADYALAPNTQYYMGLSTDGTTNYIASVDAAGIYASQGVCEQASAYTLPNPATMVVTTRAFLPLFGLRVISTAFAP